MLWYADPERALLGWNAVRWVAAWDGASVVVKFAAAVVRGLPVDRFI